jgi:hypothetical protein
MKILALEKETPGKPEDALRNLKIAEAAKAWELYQLGVIRELYFNVEQHTAILVVEQVARQYLDQLPLVEAQLIDFELVPLVPYDGFAPLFGATQSD